MLAASCKLPEGDNILETYKAVIIFFNTSPKREGLLEYISQHHCVGEEKRKLLIRTWHFLWTFLPCNNFYCASPWNNEWHPSRKRSVWKYLQRLTGFQNKARSIKLLTHAVTTLEFISGLILLYRLLHPLVGITKNLQNISVDIMRALNEVRSCIEEKMLEKTLMINFIEFTSSQKG